MNTTINEIRRISGECKEAEKIHENTDLNAMIYDAGLVMLIIFMFIKVYAAHAMCKSWKF